MRLATTALLLLSSLAACATAHDDATYVQYLGNEGVALVHNETTVLFDPLFQENYGHYSLVPEQTRDAMLAALDPYHDVAALFISHYHGDHFHPADVLKFLAVHPETTLFAPQQAVAALRAEDESVFETLDSPVVALDMQYGDKPQRFAVADLTVDVFFVPHAGWPNERTEVQNIAYRITVAAGVSVAHFGDADPNTRHFDPDLDTWHEKQTVLALPPYWFFNSTYGNEVLDKLEVENAIGIHVPDEMAKPDGIPIELEDYDLFVTPGEKRLWRSWKTDSDQGK